MIEPHNTDFKSELEKGRNITFFTVGTSMRPLLKERLTHVMIKPIENTAQLSRGDIILYIRPDGSYVLHRIVKIYKEHFQTRGDNTFYKECVSKSSAVGVVFNIYRTGKYIDACKSKSYKAYVIFWTVIYPLRYLFSLVIRALNKLLRIFKIKK